MSDHPIGYYIVKLRGTFGTVMPGAPTLELSLGVNVANGAVTGTAEISQAIAPPNGNLHFPVQGHLFNPGIAHGLKLLVLEGQYVVSFPPPAIGSYLAHFNGAFILDDHWAGEGSYSYGNHRVGPVHVTRLAD